MADDLAKTGDTISISNMLWLEPVDGWEDELLFDSVEEVLLKVLRLV